MWFCISFVYSNAVIAYIDTAETVPFIMLNSGTVPCTKPITHGRWCCVCVEHPVSSTFSTLTHSEFQVSALLSLKSNLSASAVRRVKKTLLDNQDTTSSQDVPSFFSKVQVKWVLNTLNGSRLQCSCKESTLKRGLAWFWFRFWLKCSLINCSVDTIDWNSMHSAIALDFTDSGLYIFHLYTSGCEIWHHLKLGCPVYHFIHSSNSPSTPGWMLRNSRWQSTCLQSLDPSVAGENGFIKVINNNSEILNKCFFCLP